MLNVKRPTRGPSTPGDCSSAITTWTPSSWMQPSLYTTLMQRFLPATSQQTSIHEYHSSISWTIQPFLCQIGALCITCGIQCLLHQTTSLGTLGQVPDAPSDVLDFWHGYTWDARDAHLGDHGEFRWVGGALAWKASTTNGFSSVWGEEDGRWKLQEFIGWYCRVMKLLSGRLKMWFQLWNWMDFTCFQSSNSIFPQYLFLVVTASYLTMY